MAKRPLVASELVVDPEEAERLIATSERMGAANVHHWELGLVSELLGLIYDAAGDPRLWGRFVDRFAEVMNGKMAGLFFHDMEARQGSFEYIARFDPAFARSYHEHFASVNPGVPVGKHLYRSGVFGPSHWVLDDDVLLESEYGNDWLRPQNALHQLGATMFREGSFLSSINIHRAPDQEHFGPRELGLMKVLLPHLQRAFQLYRRIGGLEAERDEKIEVLERVPCAVVLIDSEGRVVFVNRLAKEILDQNDGLSIAKSRLSAAGSQETSQLERLLHGAARTGSGRGVESGGALRVERPSMRKPLGVLVTPIRTKDDYLLRGRACAVVFLSDPEAPVDSQAELLQRTYGLTPAEARFCSVFVQGRSVSETARELKITVQTARVYLKRVLSKTDTHRQGDLMRLLLVDLPRCHPSR
jgi:DNA-binding CsgD family transcriptional regulator